MLTRRLVDLERLNSEQAARLEEFEALRECIYAAGLVTPALVQAQMAASRRRPSSNGSLSGPGFGSLSSGRGAGAQLRRSPSRSDSFAGGSMLHMGGDMDGMQRPMPMPQPPGVYIVGGHASGNTLAGAERFDPETNRWDALPVMPTPRHGCAAASVAGILYVFGGANDGGLPLSTAERYDPLLGRWERLPLVPTARHGSACASAAGVLYVVGGYDGEGVLATTERFDPVAGRWEALPSMPTARGRCAAASVDGMVYAVGGTDGGQGQELASVERLDPCTLQWERLEPMPTPRCGCAAVALAGALFVVGGRCNNEKLEVVKLSVMERFDPARGFWETVAPMFTPRDGLAAAAASDQLYVFGGRGVGQTLPTVERYSPHTGQWEALPGMPKARCGCAAAAAAR